MSTDDKEWQRFLNGHQEFVTDFSKDDSDLNITPEKEYGLTLFSGESEGYFLVFNAQIDIFQFTYLLRYFFGIENVEIGYSDESNFHHHIINNDIDDEEDHDD